jgi:hypothetical protein
MNSGVVKVTGYNTLPVMNENTLIQTLGTIRPVTAYIVASTSAFQLNLVFLQVHVQVQLVLLSRLIMLFC